MRFFTGIHQPSDARHFEAAFVSEAVEWVARITSRPVQHLLDLAQLPA